MSSEYYSTDAQESCGAHLGDFRNVHAGGIGYLLLLGTRKAERDCLHLSTDVLFTCEQIVYLAWVFGCALLTLGDVTKKRLFWGLYQSPL